jgi:protease-4
VADGRIYTAEQAVALGLVDRVGYVPEALELARRAAGVAEARVVVYRRPREYRATYYARAEGGAGLEAGLAALAEAVGPGPRFLYLWWP